MPLKIMLLAGESSGDLHGSHLALALKKASPALDLFGLGGSGMKEAGVRILADPTAKAVVGLVEVLRNLPYFRELYRRACRALDEEKPDLVVLIDYPGFNLRFAREVKRRGIRLVYYISPQIWAWGGGRIAAIRRLVDRMLVVFAFEKELYEKAGVPVTFIGHPLLDLVKPACDRLTALNNLGLADGLPVIGLLPGSRELEVRRLLPTLLKAAQRMSAELPSTAQFLLIKAPHLAWELYREILNRFPVPIKVAERWDYDGIHACDLILVASGTATLECALLNRPMVIIYKTSWPTYLAGRLLVRIPAIGLVNVVLKRRAVPELIQHRAHPAAIAREALRLWKGQALRQKMQEAYEGLYRELGKSGAAARAAQAILEELGKRG
ncbi:MAG: lipid-A-disaccharide synthase [Candidatus Omnitrophica bacterium]|nr:lipid-A-disaccharide synthase [Candidatus Omnitrophota bacterium]